MQQILCFEIVQSKVQLSKRKVWLEVEEHMLESFDCTGYGIAQHEKTKRNH